MASDKISSISMRSSWPRIASSLASSASGRGPITTSGCAAGLSGPGQFSTDEPPANCCLAVGRRAMSPHALSSQPPSPCKTSAPLKCHLHLGMDIHCRDPFSGLRFAISVSLDAERSVQATTRAVARSWGGSRAIFCRYPHWRVGRVAAT